MKITRKYVERFIQDEVLPALQGFRCYQGSDVVAVPVQHLFRCFTFSGVSETLFDVYARVVPLCVPRDPDYLGLAKRVPCSSLWTWNWEDDRANMSKRLLDAFSNAGGLAFLEKFITPLDFALKAHTEVTKVELNLKEDCAYCLVHAGRFDPALQLLDELCGFYQEFLKRDLYSADLTSATLSRLDKLRSLVRSSSQEAQALVFEIERQQIATLKLTKLTDNES